MQDIAEKIERNNKKEKKTALPHTPRVKRTMLSPFFQFIADILAVILSFNVQFYLVYISDLIYSPNEPTFAAYLFTLFAVMIFWIVVFFFSGMYKNWYIRSPFDEFFAALKIVFVGCALITFLVLLDSQQPPRFSFLVYFPVFAFFVIVNRFIARRIQMKLRIKRIIELPSLIIGTPQKAIELYEEINGSPAWGFKPIVMVFTNGNGKDENDIPQKDLPIPLYHTANNFDSILKEYRPEEVLIATDKHDHRKLLKIVSDCAENKINVKIQPDMYNIFTGQTKTLHIWGIPLIEISSQLLKPWQSAIKRIFDIFFSLLILIIGMPIWLLVALAIKLESKGPVFYKQIRAGKDGKKFKIYKFRSMVQDADKAKDKWTLVNDPRVTKAGKFIRRTHIDEIPQFWNVLKGDMSIVGPRPEQQALVEKFSREIPYFKRRLVVRPGITGWFQVKHQPYTMSKEEIENRLKYDFYYIENMSLQLDIEIIIRTILRVFRGEGQT